MSSYPINFEGPNYIRRIVQYNVGAGGEPPVASNMMGSNVVIQPEVP